MVSKDPTSLLRLREIPYNYTSFADREIILHFLDASAFDMLIALREARSTERTARMLYEVLGDMWVVTRNPYLQDDLLSQRKRWQSLQHALHHRLDAMLTGPQQDPRVLLLVDQARNAVNTFTHSLRQQRKLQHQLKRKLRHKTRVDNICFDSLSRVAHATDATDWRVACPLAVLKPDTAEEISHMVHACAALNLTLIARGGGTGYTGGAVPLFAESVVLNLEKLTELGNVTQKKLPGRDDLTAVISAGAGVVTQRVAEAAQAQGLIFAVDPTSQEACTIGGNIAMNAGGKKAVLWGTTIDNLASWEMVVADGNKIRVERINHNLGKIHLQEIVTFQITHFNRKNCQQGQAQIIQMPGSAFRKTGLGKDVTNKYLGGLPGIQKEGCDGIITAAEFVLHPKPKFTRSFCLEFFGSVKLAVPAIVEIKHYLDQHPHVALAGLEHLDERYIKAVQYATKSARGERPKMILLGDVIGDEEEWVGKACAEVVRLANARQAEGFIAVGAEARERFYAERKRTAAIAAHTNAFKINEDVVIPLDKLGDYNDEIERINIEYSTENKLAIIRAFSAYLQTSASEDCTIIDDDAIWHSKLEHALTLLSTTEKRWQNYLTHLDEPATKWLDNTEVNSIDSAASIFDILQLRQMTISFRRTVQAPLKKIFMGREYDKINEKLDSLHNEIRRSRIFVATHMHAGDGNVHTNIPVFSNDYAMMQAAHAIVQRVMKKAIALGGVISGEHGIGITKMAFVPADAIAEFTAYKNKVDPQAIFNRGKLINQAITAFTPSLKLLQQEALILEASELGELNNAIKDCVRCGKCKPDCQTHIPRANLLYSPRDKILGTSSVIEAFLYEEQTRRGISAQHFAALNDIADHCTTCHKCKNPCPVNIDFGDVSITMRTILQKRGQKNRSLGTRLTMWFLNTTSARSVNLSRALLIKSGFSIQRFLYRVLKPWQSKTALPAATVKKPTITTHVLHFAKKPFPKELPPHPVRRLLGIEDPKLVPIIRDSRKVTEQSDAVFYFPGCGSERLFSTVGLATLALLYDLGVQTVLPPGYLCCGYPQLAEGDQQNGTSMSTANRVLFHRVANTLNYLDIKTVLVSCGTCYDQLAKYAFETIFPGCRLLDIHEYLLLKGKKATADYNTQFLYHDPCHSPIKTQNPLKVAETLLGQSIVKSNRCCGDAGTLSMSRPDIATQLRYKKQQEIHKGITELTGQPRALANNVKMLTTCPACVKGLKSYTEDTGLNTDYIVVELAERLLGSTWQRDFIQNVTQGGLERVLL